MASPAELNAARLSQQLEINRQKLAVKSLQQQVSTGSKWDNIRDDWNTSDESIKNVRGTLQNLNGQNEGLRNQPGYVSTKVKLTTNITETNILIGDLQIIQRESYGNQNSASIAENIAKVSSGQEVLNAQIGADEFARNISPITSREIFEDGEVVPVIASQNKPTNANIPALRSTEVLGNAKGSGPQSTVGGEVPVRTSQQINSQSDAQGVAAVEDARDVKITNSIGNASQDVEGRTTIAQEFLKPIIPSPNRLGGLASQTYAISIYLMNIEEYKALIASDKKVLPTQQLIMQSGGAPFGERNKFFDLDFYIENLEIDSVVGSQGTGGPHNVVDMKFEIIEPQGITLLPRLTAAVKEHSGGEETVNLQNFLMVIRFYGYDEFGNLVSNAEMNGGETTSDPNALVEKFIPFQFNDITYKLTDKAVTYSVSAVIPQTQVGYSTARGSIPFNFQLNAPDIKTLLNGNVELQAATNAAEGTPPPAAKKVQGLSGRTVTAGLAQALNEHQAQLVAIGAYSVADKYSIEIEEVAGLSDAKMKKQGAIKKSATPLQTFSNPNEQLNQEKQALDTESRSYSISAGTQIVQLIDQVMKNSTYITAQQTIAFDEITNKKIQNPPVKTVQWYRITQVAEPIAFDEKRQDYAYDIRYRISRYQINTPRSPYFPDTMYRGAHKLYEYWFTGQNTEVISFEIENNTNYITSIGNDGLNNDTTGDARYTEKKFFESAPGTSTQGGDGESTRPAAQLASRLYDPADVSKSTITIVGDPDWITQSELFYTTSNLGAFEPDGSINVNAGETLYEIRFNRVVDYDMATGLTPVFKDNLDISQITGEKNLAQEAIVFTCLEVTNYFKEGKFTQKLEGTVRTFDAAVDSPQEKAKEKNQIADPGLDAFGHASPPIKKSDTPVRSSNLPAGSRGSGQFLDKRGTADNKGINLRPGPDVITGGVPASSGLKPNANNTKKSSVVPPQNYDDAIMRNKRMSTLQNSSTNYTDPIINKGKHLPTVRPKPGSNTVSDDAGKQVSPFSESLLAKRNRLKLEQSRRRIANGATVVGGQGGGTNSSAFR